ncbi:sensor histidine kinase, partial [Borreliella garinii]
VQAVGNLLDNAFKYVPKNGTVKIECGRIDNGSIFIEVSDNGPGIATDEISKVQERFYRCDTSRASPGVGLGLSVVAAVA